MELGPLGPAPAHFGLSFHDGLDVRLRGGIRRAGEESSFFDSPCKEVAGSIADVGTAWSFYRHIDAPGGAIATAVTWESWRDGYFNQGKGTIGSTVVPVGCCGAVLCI